MTLKPLSEAKKIVLILIAAILAVGIFFLISNTRKSVRIENNLSAGRQCYDDKKYEEAIDYFNQVLADDTKSIDAYYFKTNSLKALDDADSAIAVVEFGYKVTQSDVLKSLKDELQVEYQTNPVSEQQPVVSNIMPDEPSSNSSTFSSVISTENTVTKMESINITPDVKIPENIPVQTMADNSENSDDKPVGKETDAVNNDEPKNTNAEEEPVVTAIITEEQIEPETSEIPEITTVITEEKTEPEISEIPKITTVITEEKTESETSKSPEVTTVITEEQTEPETSKVPEFTTVITEEQTEPEKSTMQTIVSNTDNIYDENISSVTGATIIAGSGANPNDTSESYVTSATTSVDSLSDEEYEYYKSLIEKIIDKIISFIGSIN